MAKKLVFVFCIALLGTACGSEVKRLKETEYLRTHPGKPLVYPQDVDRPEQEKTYVIPELPKTSATSPEAPELLVLPPRLAGVDLSEDKEKTEKGASEGQDEGKSLDEGFIETPRP